MQMITAQHAARAHEIHTKFDEFADEVEAAANWCHAKLVHAAHVTAELVESAARVHASEKKSQLSKQIMASRVSLRGMRHDMSLILMQKRLEDLQSRLSELQAMQLMAPLLDACPE